MVENRDLLGSGGQALFYDLGDQLGIGVAGQFGRFVPADIRFDGHFGPCFDELFHAAHFGDRFAEHGVRFAAHDGDQVGFPPVAGSVTDWASRSIVPPGLIIIATPVRAIAFKKSRLSIAFVFSRVVFEVYQKRRFTPPKTVARGIG